MVSNWVSGSAFSTIAHSYPWPDFSWNPEAPTAGEIIQLEDLTTFYNGFGIWEWDFDGDGMTDSTIRNATTSYAEENPEGYEVSLKVKDGLNYGPCATTQNVSVRKPLPEWQEAPPF